MNNDPHLWRVQLYLFTLARSSMTRLRYNIAAVQSKATIQFSMYWQNQLNRGAVLGGPNGEIPLQISLANPLPYLFPGVFYCYPHSE